MTRQEALREVSGWLALGLERSTGDLEYAAGVTPEQREKLTQKDREAYEWAADEVARRLRAMGQSRQASDDRVRVSRRLYRSALADAISWTESLVSAQAGTPSENPDDRKRLADYRGAYTALTGSKSAA
jgi:hypothetical protein